MIGAYAVVGALAAGAVSAVAAVLSLLAERRARVHGVPGTRVEVGGREFNVSLPPEDVEGILTREAEARAVLS
jgi:hypothetical protein